MSLIDKIIKWHEEYLNKPTSSGSIKTTEFSQGETFEANNTSNKFVTVQNKETQKTENNKCYCNRDFTVQEVTEIITKLRKSEDKRQVAILDKIGNKQWVDKNGKVISSTNRGRKPPGAISLYTEEKNMFDDVGTKIFYLEKVEKISSSDATLEKFTDALNKTLKDYDITTCIRKIHFLAQCYHETQRFGLTYESNPNKNILGGKDFRGRGMIQLTHDYSYAKYYRYLYENTENFKKLDFNKGKIEDLEVPKSKENNDKKRKKVVDSKFYKEELMPFRKKISMEIKFACDSSGWKWKFDGVPSVGKNINLLADKDDVLLVSQAINGNVTVPNGLEERKKYTILLKEIMEYEKNHK